MKNRPLHENLDTSFINLSALIRYLRRRHFVGKVRVELCGYEADVILTADNQMKVLEHDAIAGRISEGEEALQRLLIRAREPGGVIHVYQKVKETAPILENSESTGEKKPSAAKSPFVEKSAKPSHQNGNSKTAKAEPLILKENLPPPKPNLPKFPFELSNNFEAKAGQTNFEPSDWQTLLNLTAELLRLIDKSFTEANLDFSAAFEKARAEVAADYPFLNRSANTFVYKDGRLVVREQINFKFFAASINELLRRILEKLGRNPKFSNLYRIITEKIRVLVERRRLLYDKFTITPSLEKAIRAR